MTDLHDIEAIKRLKYTYLRALDLKQWDEMAACFTEDATAAYSDGRSLSDERTKGHGGSENHENTKERNHEKGGHGYSMSLSFSCFRHFVFS